MQTAPDTASATRTEHTFELILQRSQMRLPVGPGESMADVLQLAGVPLETLCEQGYNVFVEVGPHPILRSYVSDALAAREQQGVVIATLKRYKPARAGVIHAFAGSYEEAREYIKLGFRLGLGGAGTWPQALRLRKTLARLPLDSVVLETDAPDMAPVMFPGVRNSPEHLPEIAGALAQVMGVEVGELAEASSRNACELFRW